ncbi:UNVERIFIED_CONTAM: protein DETOXIFICATION 51 [Sesamum latifolium]|uniref:Protein DETOXIFICATION n=1 Tax=Sesamum latifolium TaxID=2727402 RepID=A0AAW2U1B5_9LAMI
MCNPNPLPDHSKHPPPPPPPCHLYLDLISVTTTFKHQETTKPPPSQISSLPSATEILTEAKALLNLAFPIALTALILYSRSMLSMLFLGHLGDIELAAGSLAIAFANITGYSVLSGLALGMEPLCAQAFGAQRPKLLSLTLQRAVVFLLHSSVFAPGPQYHQIGPHISCFFDPDLITNSFIHPIRIYLRAQGITHPLTLASLVGTAFHLPINFLLVSRLRLGVAGVAAASAASNLVVLLALVIYVWARGLHVPTWTKPSVKCLTGWGPLVRLAAPSCVSVCLEWWWYEIMIVLCGLLVDPKATVASMGVLIQTTSLLYVFPSSLSLAVSTRVGNELGANRPKNARVSAIVSIFLAGVMGLSAMTFATSMRNRWAQMYTNDLNIVRLTSAALPILGLCELGNCPQTVGCGVVRGTARPSTAANVNLGAFYLVGMPVAIGLGFLLGVGFCGLWIGLLSAQVCCAGLMLYVVGTTNWEYQAMRAQLLTCAGCSETTLPPRDGDENDSEPLISVRVTSS